MLNECMCSAHGRQSHAKIAEPIEVPFAGKTAAWVKGTTTFVLRVVHIGAAEQIRLNDLCASVMQPYVKLR